MCDIVMRRQKQLVRLPEPVMRAEVRINVEWLIQAFAIIDRSLLQLVDRSIDLSDRHIVVMPLKLQKQSTTNS